MIACGSAARGTHLDLNRIGLPMVRLRGIGASSLHAAEAGSYAKVLMSGVLLGVGQRERGGMFARGCRERS